MTDDPHDATWIPPVRKVVWCPVCNADMEGCGCHRAVRPRQVILSILILASLIVPVVIAIII